MSNKILMLLIGFVVFPVQGELVLDIPILDEELQIIQYPAQGEHLVIWVAPGFGSHERAFNTSQALAEKGIEVWHVDLADSLFLPKSTSTMRGLSGKYMAGLIHEAHRRSQKKITLLTRSYGALPLLKGVRQWQIENSKHSPAKTPYLSGAILFSPEMYDGIPSLGLDPIYSPISYASNIPLVIYQADKRGNRWQLDELMENLRAGGSAVFLKVMPQVTGVFYSGDKSSATLTMLQRLPDELARVIDLLDRLPTPVQAAPDPQKRTIVAHGLDTELRPFVGDPFPHDLDLKNASGERVKRTDYRNKVTVVNFWATWCPPCIREIPNLNGLRQQMSGKAFELISVNYAEDEKRVLEFLKQVNVEFPVLMDRDGRVSAQWKVLLFPSTFIIGPDGLIRYGVNGAIHWDSPEVVGALQHLLNGSD